MTEHLKQRTATRMAANKTGPAITTEEAEARMAVKPFMMQVCGCPVGGYDVSDYLSEMLVKHLANQGFVIRRKGEDINSELVNALSLLLNDPKTQLMLGGNPDYVEKVIETCHAALAKAQPNKGE